MAGTLSLLLALILLLVEPVSGQEYPGVAIFSVQCEGESIIFLENGTPVITVQRDQVNGPLTVAILIQQNQPIVFGNAVSLWALKSDELQIHRDSDPEGTKLVVSSDICGAVATMTDGNSLAAAFAILSGPGEAMATVRVTPYGYSMAAAQVFGSGTAMAYAGANPFAPHIPSGRRYLVQWGDTLFRIAMFHNTTVSELMALNGLDNPHHIVVGEVLQLP